MEKGHSPVVAFGLGDISKFFAVVVEAENIECDPEKGTSISR